MKKILLGISLLTTLSIACKVKATKENTSKENVNLQKIKLPCKK
jgi:hypothetical protein